MFIDILDCYLQENLAINGGFLDEVQFLVNTNEATDLKWLNALVNTTAAYSRVDSDRGFKSMWNKHAVEHDVLYVKIDDDLVRRGTFPFRAPVIPSSS